MADVAEYGEPWKVDNELTVDDVSVEDRNADRVLVVDCADSWLVAGRVALCVNFCQGVPDAVLSAHDDLLGLIKAHLRDREDVAVMSALADEMMLQLTGDPEILGSIRVPIFIWTRVVAAMRSGEWTRDLADTVDGFVGVGREKTGVQQG